MIIAGVFSLLLSTGVLAESNTRSLAEEYIILSKVEKTFDATIDSYVEQMSTAQPDENKDDIRGYFQFLISWDKIKEPTIDIVMERFTAEELKAINKFYKTKTGKVVADKSSLIAVDISNVINKTLEAAFARPQK